MPIAWEPWPGKMNATVNGVSPNSHVLKARQQMAPGGGPVKARREARAWQMQKGHAALQTAGRRPIREDLADAIG
jgi:hypothetical protein